MSKLPKPLRRKEYYLEKLAKKAMGEEVTKAMPKPLTRTETYLNALADNAKTLPQVTSEDNGNVLAVVEGAWAKAQPSGGESPVSVYDVCFDDFTYDSEAQKYVGKAYWGRVKDASKEIIKDTTSFCSQMEADLLAGKVVFINVWMSGSYTPTVVQASRYDTVLWGFNITGTIGQGGQTYFPDPMGATDSYVYKKSDISLTTDGKFDITQIR